MTDPPASVSQRPRRRWPWLVAGTAVLVAASAWFTLRPRARPQVVAPETTSPPAILHHDEGGLRYSYHVPTGAESLFDLTTDPGCLKNLAPERPEDTRRMRRALEAKLGVDNLEELQENWAEQIERLRGLGYL